MDETAVASMKLGVPLMGHGARRRPARGLLVDRAGTRTAADNKRRTSLQVTGAGAGRTGPGLIENGPRAGIVEADHPDHARAPHRPPTCTSATDGSGSTATGLFSSRLTVAASFSEDIHNDIVPWKPGLPATPTVRRAGPSRRSVMLNDKRGFFDCQMPCSCPLCLGHRRLASPDRWLDKLGHYEGVCGCENEDIYRQGLLASRNDGPKVQPSEVDRRDHSAAGCSCNSGTVNHTHSKFAASSTVVTTNTQRIPSPAAMLPPVNGPSELPRNVADAVMP